MEGKNKILAPSGESDAECTRIVLSVAPLKATIQLKCDFRTGPQDTEVKIWHSKRSRLVESGRQGKQTGETDSFYSVSISKLKVNCKYQFVDV